MKRLFKKLSRRKIATFTLMIVVFVMSLGYAALSQYIEIEGMAMIDRSWIIAITNVESSVTNNGVANSNTFINNTVTLNSTLPTSSSTVTYTITLENKGNIVAKFAKLHVIEDDNTSIAYDLTGVVEEETVLSPGEKNTVTVTIKYKEGVTSASDLNKSVMFTFDYIEYGTSSNGNISQGEGTSGAIKYIAYKPGDIVSLDPGSGSVQTFYVISTDDTIYNATVKLLAATVYTSPPSPDASFLPTNYWTRGVVSFLTMEDVARVSGFKYDSTKDYEGQKTAGSNYLGSYYREFYVEPGYFLTTTEEEGILSKNNSSDYYPIRPVITVDKGYLQQYASYEAGEEVTLLDGSEWIVTKDSASHDAYITLFAMDAYGEEVPFDTTGSPNYNPSSTTNVGYYVDNTIVPMIKESLDNYSGNTNGITGRLLTYDEIEKLYYDLNLDLGSTYTWLIGNYWTDTSTGTNYGTIWFDDMTYEWDTTQPLSVRPVITISKDNIQNIMMGYQMELDTSNSSSIYSADIPSHTNLEGIMIYYNNPSSVVEHDLHVYFAYISSVSVNVSAKTSSIFVPVPTVSGVTIDSFAYLYISENTATSSLSSIEKIELLYKTNDFTSNTIKPVTVYFGTTTPTSRRQYSFDNGTTWQDSNYKQYSENVSDYIKIKNLINGDTSSIGMPYTISGIDANPVVKITRTSGTLGYNNWYRTAVGLKIDATGLEGISTINYCTATGATSCTPNTQVSASSTTLTVSNYNNTTVVCVNATSTTGITGDTVCNTYKIDTIAPYISNYDSVLANATVSQTNSSGTAVNATMSNKTCDSTTATCSALVCLSNVAGKFNISGVQIAGADALSGYYSSSVNKTMYDKNGNAISNGCLITQNHNPCIWKWIYTYRDYAGNTNKVTINFSLDYQGYNACA